jgi:hypothetical protein
MTLARPQQQPLGIEKTLTFTADDDAIAEETLKTEDNSFC